jgi:hypothetical protein
MSLREEGAEVHRDICGQETVLALCRVPKGMR